MKQHRQEYMRKWMAAYRARKKTDVPNEQCNSVSDSSVSDNTQEETVGHRTAAAATVVTWEVPLSSSTDSCMDSDSTSTNELSPLKPEDLDRIWDCIDQHDTVSSETEDEDDSQSVQSLPDMMRQWVIRYSVKHNAVDDMLRMWRCMGHTELPSTARTLLKTPNEMLCKELSGMQYTYLGLKEELLMTFQRYPKAIQKETTALELSINIDGLPLFKSSRASLWPILCAVVNMKPRVVFPVALLLGRSKPSDLEFAVETIEALQDLMENGLKVNDGKDRVLHVRLRSVVCDAPAKAMVKATKLYSGYHGCDKCDQAGKWEGRMTYPEIDELNLRTDESFRQKTDAEHHHGDTPFSDLQIDMVKAFPIDYMHQICLGVTKRLMLIWLRGPKKVRITAGHAREIGERLLSLQGSIPKCFARKPRSCSEIDRWKATEFRQFLLYTGKVVLRNILPDELYHHFLALCVAINILICPSQSNELLGYAQQLLEWFVSEAKELYGAEILYYIVYNVHSLLHITAEAKEYGCLDNGAAFIFESFLQRIKRSMRSGTHVLAQINKRLKEQSTIPIESTKNLDISVSRPNNSFVLHNGAFCEVIGKSDEADETGSKKLLCRVYSRTKAEPLFKSPCDSRLLGTAVAKDRDVKVQFLRGDALKGPAIMINNVQKQSVTFITLPHDIFL